VARALFGPLPNRLIVRERMLAITLAAVVLLISIGLAVSPQLMNDPVSRALTAFAR